MRRKGFIYLLLLASAAIVLSACKLRNEEQEIQQKVPVRIVQVDLEEIRLLVSASGRLYPSSEQKLSFKTGGIINKVYVSEGQEVKYNQLLTDLKINEIKALVSQATEAYNKANRDFRRVENLYRDTVATLEQFQNARTALNLASSQLEIAKFNLQHSSIMAPSDGRVLKKLAENNELIAPGYPVILFGSERGFWLLRVNVTDREIVLLNPGDTANVTFDAFPDKVFEAMISEKSAFANPYTGLFEITLELVSDTNQFVAGFIGKAEIRSGQIEEYFSIPVEALLEAQGNEGQVHVYENEKAVRRNIQIFRIEKDRILVTKGITSMDWVISDGTSFVRSNSILEVIK
jgi:membrane fusion protein, multidrug efflux system